MGILAALKGIKVYFWVVLGVILLSLVGSGIWFVHKEDVTIANQQKTIVTLTQSINNDNTTIKNLQDDFKKQQEVTVRVTDQYNKAQTTISSIVKKNNNTNALVTTDPGEATTIYNSDFNHVNECVEISTGATAKDLNLTDKAFNDEKASCSN